MTNTQEGLKIRPKGETRWDLVSLAEVMLRFDPGDDRITRTRNFRVWEGGGEYNVARGLRRCFEQRTSVVTVLADNPVGRLLEDLMLQGGVDLSHLIWSEYDGVGNASRNGIYFMERGFGNRPALGMMDRGHTPISKLKAGQIDWDAIFGGEGVRWFHTGGIMCALSDDSPDVAREAMESARRHGVIVSYDCNYRPSLWKGRGGRQAACNVNRMLAPLVDVFLGHDGDIATTLSEASAGPPWHDRLSYSAMSERVHAEFPNIKVVATTMRRPHTASRNDWAAFAWCGNKVYESIQFLDMDIYDRVGGGDSFSAGLIYGLMEDRGMQWSLDCGVAHGALAMTTPGDSSMATLAQVEHAMKGGSAGVQR
jgi:2-dehydro-3-deoxygluconokinase